MNKIFLNKMTNFESLIIKIILIKNRQVDIPRQSKRSEYVFNLDNG